jgi:transcriptional regulator with XRE-family HTH domain
VKQATHPARRVDQNPREFARDNTLEVSIGRRVHTFRTKLGIMVADLAAAAKLSPSMVSRIEHGLTSPSLTTLRMLSAALGLPVTAFLGDHEERPDAVFVRAGQALTIERRGTHAEHQYRLLGHPSAISGRVVAEPYLITLKNKSDVFPIFQHLGLEFIYVLEGEIVYRHEDRLYRLRPGDSFFFHSDASHGPEKLLRLPIKFLSVRSYARDET